MGGTRLPGALETWCRAQSIDAESMDYVSNVTVVWPLAVVFIYIYIYKRTRKKESE